jgi:adiponectin receptor
MGVNPPGHELPTWPIAVFLFTAVCALSFSAVFHLCFCNSEHVSCALARFDYAGIGMLIVGSTVPAIYYSMFCQTEWVFFYLSVSGIINVMTTLATFSETMALPQVGFLIWLN